MKNSADRLSELSYEDKQVYRLVNALRIVIVQVSMMDKELIEQALAYISRDSRDQDESVVLKVISEETRNKMSKEPITYVTEYTIHVKEME